MHVCMDGCVDICVDVSFFYLQLTEKENLHRGTVKIVAISLYANKAFQKYALSKT